jgi:hypothetical protein
LNTATRRQAHVSWPRIVANRRSRAPLWHAHRPGAHIGRVDLVGAAEIARRAYVTDRHVWFGGQGSSCHEAGQLANAMACGATTVCTWPHSPRWFAVWVPARSGSPASTIASMVPRDRCCAFWPGDEPTRGRRLGRSRQRSRSRACVASVAGRRRADLVRSAGHPPTAPGFTRPDRAPSGNTTGRCRG